MVYVHLSPIKIFKIKHTQGGSFPDEKRRKTRIREAQQCFAKIKVTHLAATKMVWIERYHDSPDHTHPIETSDMLKRSDAIKTLTIQEAEKNYRPPAITTAVQEMAIDKFGEGSGVEHLWRKEVAESSWAYDSIFRWRRRYGKWHPKCDQPSGSSEISSWSISPWKSSIIIKWKISGWRIDKAGLQFCPTRTIREVDQAWLADSLILRTIRINGNGDCLRCMFETVLDVGMLEVIYSWVTKIVRQSRKG